MSSMSSYLRIPTFVVFAVVGVVPLGQIRAQLVVTEMMIDSIGSDDAWEWIEVRNTGVSDIDFNGFIGAKFGELGEINGELLRPAVINDAEHDLTTVIPAGQVGILYNAQPTGYDESLFRQAWGLSSSVPLIAANSSWPVLTQTGANLNFGYWANETAFEADLSPTTKVVTGFTNASFYVDYSQVGWPDFSAAENVGVSFAWNGTGDYHTPGNWAFTTTGTTSIAVESVKDYGNPGLQPDPLGTPPTGKLVVTEVMYNPESPDAQWEWIEVYNNTGSVIDFSTSPGVFDDRTGVDIGGPNLNSGSIPVGGTAVLFDGVSNTLAEMQQYWTDGGTLTTNFISVDSNWPDLNNTDDKIGIWLSKGAYDGDRDDDMYDNAVGSLTYDEQGGTPPSGVSGTWPNQPSSGGRSIWLANLSGDPTVGESWTLADAADGLSFLGGLATIHDGGDLGTPGTVPGGFAEADFNNSTTVDETDLGIWNIGYGSSGAAKSDGDATGEGLVSGEDFLIWQRQYTGPNIATAVPEPTSAALAAVLLAGAVAVVRGGRSPSDTADAVRL